MKRRFAALWAPAAAAALMLTLGACSGLYYDAMEQLGFEKRDILVDRVEDSRDAQREASEQFQSALEQFIAVTDFEGGDLEAVYRRLDSEYQASVRSAEAVRERIAEVEDVASALFREWENELDLYDSDAMRRASERQLEQTQERYRQMIAAMHEAEQRIEPVLEAFQDRVLYLKHNLNARAIGSLRADRQEIEADLRRLVEEMNASIEEANAFIAELGG
jgi:hypothetical protein